MFRALARACDGFEEDEEWVARTLRLFPVPDIRYVPYLFAALDRLVRATPWLAEGFGGPGLTGPLSRVIPRLEAAKTRDPRLSKEFSAKQIRSEWTGAFTLALTLFGTESAPTRSKGFEALRCVIWICWWRWAESENPRRSAIDILASAVRGAILRRTDSQSSLDPRLLHNIGQAQSLEEFIDSAAGIIESGHKTLASAWKCHFDPVLRGAPRPKVREQRTHGPGVGRRTGLAPAEIAAPPASHPGRARATGGGREFERLQENVRRRHWPASKSTPRPLPGEAYEEHQSPVYTAPLTAVPRNDDAKRMLRYQVQQAVWSANHLLVTNHSSVLPLSPYRRIVRYLIDKLGEGKDAPDRRFGQAALLLAAMTGRTPRSLTAVEVLAGSDAPHDPRKMEFLLQQGVLRLSVFWRVARSADGDPSYFRPDAHQAGHLEPVESVFQLPLAPQLLQAMKLASGEVEKLACGNVERIEAWLREAAREASGALGINFSVGQLRASMSTHLFDQCRDTALTQLICADSLGLSLAPLSYYAPRAKDVAATYWRFQGALLESVGPMPATEGREFRIGAPLMARQTAVLAMARAPSAPLHLGVKRLAGEGRGREVHAAMTNQVAAMMVAVATHRPVEALFELTFDDVWIDGEIGAALFRDKVHDVAHDPRLVALPKTLCRQLRAYLEHLQGLAVQFPQYRSHVAKVLKGQAPMLFAWSEEGLPKPIKLSQWRRALPPAWQTLPLNWGRHWLRTRAIEEGLRPELVTIQLGHLEAAGYPFSGASPAEPEAFIAEVAPVWERLAREQGWQVVHGFRASGALEPDLLRPLKLWDVQVRDHKRAMREQAKAWQEFMKSRLRSYRERAEVEVLAHRELVEHKISDRYLGRDLDLGPHPLARKDFERIRDELHELAADDLAFAYALADALCRIVRRVNKKTRQSAEDPAPIWTVRRPVDNVFVPGMMQAVRQVRALREHVRTWSSRNKPGDWRDFSAACARAVAALTLFGFCDDAAKIRGAIERRHRLQRSAVLTDAVLVPWGDEPHQVMGIRGVAAAAFARLAWKYCGCEFPGWEEVNEKLVALMPGWALATSDVGPGSGSGLVERICQTVAISNRFEFAPGTRLALAEKQGSTNAHINEQIALVDGDPPGTLDRSWEEEADRPRGVPTISGEGKSADNSRSQYLRLCAVFPAPDRDTRLPLTGVTILSRDSAAESSRTTIANEIDAMLAVTEPSKRLQPIVLLLAAWTLDMLVNGTARLKRPAFTTVKTYLTRIGGGLVQQFGQSTLRHLDDGELEDAYLAVVEATESSRAIAAAAIRNFHQFALIHNVLPEVDLSAVNLFLADDAEAKADARLILPKERESVVAELARQAGGGGGKAMPTRNDLRQMRQASAAIALIAYGGARRNEALGIQFRDITQAMDLVQVRFRANKSRRLKTRNAARTLELPTALCRLGPASLAEWADADRARLPSRRSGKAFVFAPLDDARNATGRSALAETCLGVCRQITGRRYDRLHAFRHLVAMELITPVFLSAGDFAALAPQINIAPLHLPPEVCALPRDLHTRVVSLGHGNATTTLRWYYHLPWLLRSRADEQLTARHMTREVMATLLGVTPHAMDSAARNTAGRPKGEVWMDVQCPPRHRPLTLDAEPVQTSDAPKPWTARELGQLLAGVSRMRSLNKVLLIQGGNGSDADRLRLAFAPVEAHLGRRLLEDQAMASMPRRPKRAIRHLAAAAPVEAFWEWFDEDVDARREPLIQLAEEIAEQMVPADLDRIRLRSSSAPMFQALLEQAGICRDRVTREPIGAGLEQVRVTRLNPERALPDSRTSKPEDSRYLGLAIKRIFLVIRIAHRGI